MIQNVLQHIGGVAGYGIVSLCLFFAVFVGVLGVVCRMKRADLQAAAALPLQDDPPPAARKEDCHD